MTTTEKWTNRILEWRESGLTSDRFCEGRDFTSNALRNWAYRLGMTKRRRRGPRLQIARVLRVPAALTAPSETSAGGCAQADSALSVEFGSARVVVRAGFDRETLAAVFDLLAAHAGR